MPAKAKSLFEKRRTRNLSHGRMLAQARKAQRREKQAHDLVSRHGRLSKHVRARESMLIALSMLYLAEGSKTERSGVMFGNSNPSIVMLFLRLLRTCFSLDESRFRITVQCRADQDQRKLEHFWSEVTKIPLTQFYATRVDARSLGKKTLKQGYRGVCRIDYFSVEIDRELKYLAGLVERALIS
jgi:hypothetical protein